jgi:hypothetical protein
MKPPLDKPRTRPGGRAADRLRDFLEKRLPPEEAEAELEKRTNIKPEERKKSDRREIRFQGRTQKIVGNFAARQ